MLFVLVGLWILLIFNLVRINIPSVLEEQLKSQKDASFLIMEDGLEKVCMFF